MISNKPKGDVAAGNPELDMIVGVTSMGSKNCVDGSPSIYTSIGAFWDWILKEIGEDDVNCSPNLLFCPDCSVQVQDTLEVTNGASQDDEDDVRSSELNEHVDDKVKEEKSEQQEREEWREEMRRLSQKELIKVALTMKIVGNDRQFRRRRFAV